MSVHMYIRFVDRISRQRVLSHLLFWLAVTIFFFFVFRSDRTPLRMLAINAGFMPGHLIFVYSLLYLLVPRFIQKKNIYISIFLFLVVLFTAILYGRWADTYLLHYSNFNKFWVPGAFPRAIFAFFSIGWIAVSIKLLKYSYFEKETRQQLEKEKLTVELELLKSQLHPHFLFNTLNNLYSLTLEGSSQAPRAVLQLSALLRYMLYECNQPLADLGKEIEVLQTYIALEKFRFRERLEISASFTGDIENRPIAPLLLLPFVENAIKHGTGEQLDKCWMSLHLHVTKDILTFKLINSARLTREPAHSGGLGLQNVRRRLNLLYPDHQLKIISDEDTFMVSLTLRLSGSKEAIRRQPLQNDHYETKMPAHR